MNYVFFGTPKFAAIVLEKLIGAGLIPEAVVCNPDEPVGRKKVLTAPPTKIIAQTNNIPIFQPQKLEIGNWKPRTRNFVSVRDQSSTELRSGAGLEINELGNIDLAIVAAYNKIIPEAILNSLPAKFIGVHPSLLPKYRGPSPIQTAVLNGDKETGANLFLIDKEIDHGPVLAGAKCDISEKDNYETMERKLAELGAKLLIENLQKYLDGKIKSIEQNHEKATFTKKFSTEDGRVDLPEYLAVCHSRETCPRDTSGSGNPESEKTWIPYQVRNDKIKSVIPAKAGIQSPEDSPESIFNKIRALNPDPGVFTFISTKNGLKRIKLLEAEIKDGKLELLKVQPEGKKPMSYKDFLNGLKSD